MNYKLSVVVPVYRVEKYIERCIRSLFEQTLDAMEFVFVNDCTDDKSIDILRCVINEYPHRQEHIKIINLEKNTGLPNARKVGIENSTGEYIAFCDSDDWVDKEAYRLMVETAASDDCDIVVCDYMTVSEDCTKSCQSLYHYDKPGFISDMLYGKTSWSLCNKMFGRELFSQDITYPTQNMGEDGALTLQLSYYSHKTGYVNKPLYNYLQRTTSIVNTKTEENVHRKYEQAMANSNLVMAFFKDKEISPLVSRGLTYMLYRSRALLISNYRNPHYLKMWRESCPGIDRKIMLDINAPLKERMRAMLSLLRLYPIITNAIGLTKCN